MLSLVRLESLAHPRRSLLRASSPVTRRSIPRERFLSTIRSRTALPITDPGSHGPSGSHILGSVDDKLPDRKRTWLKIGNTLPPFTALQIASIWLRSL